MPLPILDPHPHGCPLGVAVTPEQMPEAIRGLCHKLRDVLHPSLHVINPSRGASYPILSLYADDSDVRARVVLFPGWESNVRSRRRRIGYARQMTLLQRIVDAGVRGEAVSVDETALHGDVPLQISLACTADKMPHVVRDLYTYLGDRLRLTVSTWVSGKAAKGWPDLCVVKLYSPFHDVPRVVLFPAWTGLVERPDDRMERLHQDVVLREMTRRRTPEIEVEDYLA